MYDHHDLLPRMLAEFIGSAFLLVAVVGSGIMAEQLSTDLGLQLLANSFATAGALVALILAFQGASGAHFNPAVSLADHLFGDMDATELAGFAISQVAGGITGVIAANLMFDLDAITWSTKDRSSLNLVFAEGVATLGLLLVIYGVVRAGRPTLAAFSVGGYIAGAYWFTSSTSFANPAVTIARTFSDTFAGIEPSSVPPFIAAQLVATFLAVVVIRVIFPKAQVDE